MGKNGKWLEVLGCRFEDVEADWAAATIVSNQYSGSACCEKLLTER
jgi:hypothetical protein